QPVFAVIRHVQQAEHVQQGGFTGTGRSHHRQVFTSVNIQLNIIQRVHRFVAELEGFVYTTNADQCVLIITRLAHGCWPVSGTSVTRAPATAAGLSSRVRIFWPSCKPLRISVQVQLLRPMLTACCCRVLPSALRVSTWLPSSKASVGIRKVFSRWAVITSISAL